MCYMHVRSLIGYRATINMSDEPELKRAKMPLKLGYWKIRGVSCRARFRSKPVRCFQPAVVLVISPFMILRD